MIVITASPPPLMPHPPPFLSERSLLLILGPSPLASRPSPPSPISDSNALEVDLTLCTPGVHFMHVVSNGRDVVSGVGFAENKKVGSSIFRVKCQELLEESVHVT